MSFGDLNVKFTSDVTGLNKGFKAVQDGVKKTTGSIASLVKSAASLAGVTLGVKALADSFKAFTALESNAARVSDIFGAAGKNIQAFAEGSAKGFGLAESSVYEYASTFGNLFKNITSGMVENSAVTIQMLQASAVVASKTGRTMEDVMSRIRSGLLGSTEAIEDLGINVNIAMLEMTDAFKRIADGRSWAQLTFYEQQQIRTLGILEQAHKNFGDTVQQGSAFSLSLLSSAFKDLTATAGGFVNAALQPIIGGLATITQLATTALKSLSAMLGFNATLSQTATGLTAGSDAAAEMAGGVEDTTKAAQKLNRQLAGFDKFNDITASASGAGSAAAGAGGAGGMGIEMEFEQLEPPDLTWTDKLLGWAKGFNDLIAPLKTSLSGLWDTLKNIGGFAWQGLKGFYEGFLKPVGVWVLGTGLPKLVDALKKGLEAVDWGKINDSFSRLWDALAPFAINIGEGLLWLWENVLVPFGTWTMNEVVPRYLGVLASSFGFLNEVINAVKPGLKWIWEKFLLPIAQWTGGVITGTLDLINEKLQAASQWVADNKDSIERALKNIGDSLSWLWQYILKPVLDMAAKLIEEGVSNSIDQIGSILAFVVHSFSGEWDKAWGDIKNSFFTNFDSMKTRAQIVLNGVKAIWAPLGAWFSTTVLTPVGAYFSKTLDSIGAGWATIWENVKELWGKASEWFSEKVLEPIKSGFKEAINFLIWMVEGFANGFVSAINGIIEALNGISFEVPDWVPGIGGERFGVSIPLVPTVALPRLAKGGLAYGEVQAIVGDNRNARQDPEVISPLSRLQEMITGAMFQRDIAGGGSTQPINLRMVLEDGTVFAEAMIDPMNRTAKNLGYGPVFRVEMA